MSAPLYPRILLKLSGEVLRSPAGTDCIDSAILADMAEKIEAVRATGVQVAIVIGGGNIFRGLSGTGKGVPRAHGDNMGMLATMINSLALQAALATRDVPAVVLSSRAMPAICELFTFQRARALLDAGTVVILGGGSGNPFFTTDSAAALRAAEVGASLLVKATKVDGIYTADPTKDPTATRFDRITYAECLSRRLKVMDSTAFSLCQDNAIPIMVLNFFQPGALLAALSGDTTVATLVTEEGKS
ncbi:MAG: UMP kinase [Kiritimatiellae bacterium]|nr:UMP kinase [Kiritimatiellia bacterium]MBQ9343954.1 UMP kinase [Kiritimatiellia bacterium]